MESNLKIGNNSAKGLYVGDNKIMGGGQKITLNNLYEDSLPVEVLIVNLTNADVTVGFKKDSSIGNEVGLKPFEIRTFGGFTTSLINNFTIHCSVKGTYELYTSLKLVQATTDSNQEVNAPEIEFVHNASDLFVGTDYQSTKWEYVAQSTKRRDTFVGGWIVLNE